MLQAPLIEITKPRESDKKEFLAAVARSTEFHFPWVEPPETDSLFDIYLSRVRQTNHRAFFLRCGDTGRLAGVVNVNEIVRGALLSGYLGYYAFSGYEQRGVMTVGVSQVISHMFYNEGLHRLEANIQPTNEPSKALARRCGLHFEGLSPRYLYLVGAWRDHERWAITAEELRE